ncbi:hypothetical protein [Enterococcus hermanniensis]|uniref:Uncharacterized protein n=1 Tax=Enterococcus hermanniensis TaxID=249189 RepID=A0A1L8TPI3_9ENTE|nr:hypothetical protein [Enterococcus hermanniensis]OJG46241.1 hypothetical protein RV04_GL001407 [Enterococcus hermanniensis]
MMKTKRNGLKENRIAFGDQKELEKFEKTIDKNRASVEERKKEKEQKRAHK